MATPLLNCAVTTQFSSGGSTICAGRVRFPGSPLSQTPFIDVMTPTVFDGFFPTGLPAEISPPIAGQSRQILQFLLQIQLRVVNHDARTHGRGQRYLAKVLALG